MNNTIFLQRRAEVLKRWPVSKSTLYSKINKSEFVPPVNIGDRAVAWISSEVDALIIAMAAGKSDIEIKTLVAELVAQRQKAS
tara:strand:+ start:216 stop:464 length:249 start_codon:yes stop_codon:yes gene_type:complete